MNVKKAFAAGGVAAIVALLASVSETPAEGLDRNLSNYGTTDSICRSPG